MKLFNFDIHIGKWRVLVQTRDVADKAVTGSKIADRAVNWFHIIKKAVRNEHIDDSSVDARTIADDAVHTRHIHEKAVTPDKVSDNFVSTLVQPLVDKLSNKHDKDVKDLKARDADLQNQIDSQQIHGLAVSNMFGNDPHIGISQKTLTLAMNKLWSKIEDITGEVYQGFVMQANPEYYIGEDGCTLTITASSENSIGIFEKIAFFWNYEEEPFYSAENIVGIDAMKVELPEDKLINDKVIIRCEAQILGMPYSDQKSVTHYSSFFLGGGSTYEDVMDVEHVIPLTHHMRGAHDIEVADGEHIIIVLGDSLASGFIRADINGVEIAFNESSVVVGEKLYKVFTSENTYQEGTYNIDING